MMRSGPCLDGGGWAAFSCTETGSCGWGTPCPGGNPRGLVGRPRLGIPDAGPRLSRPGACTGYGPQLLWVYVHRYSWVTRRWGSSTLVSVYAFSSGNTRHPERREALAPARPYPNDGGGIPPGQGACLVPGRNRGDIDTSPHGVAGSPQTVTHTGGREDEDPAAPSQQNTQRTARPTSEPRPPSCGARANGARGTKAGNRTHDRQQPGRSVAGTGDIPVTGNRDRTLCVASWGAVRPGLSTTRDSR
jgi:hypothetical protein